MKPQKQGAARGVTILACLRLGAWLSLAGLTACKESGPAPAVDYLRPVAGDFSPFDVLVDDVDGDGRKDLQLIDHGGNRGQTLLQKPGRRFEADEFYAETGFHPGNLLRWPGESPLFVLGAEGENQIRALRRTWSGSYEVVSSLELKSPRYAYRLDWPGWGPSLAVSPYNNDQIDLLKGYDPLLGKVAERISVPLAKRRPSVREPRRLHLTDIDGDGVEDILIPLRLGREVMAIRYPGNEAPTATVLHKNEKWAMPKNLTSLDLDGQNGVDLLVPDEIAPGRLHVLLNQGKGEFAEAADLKFAHDYGMTGIAAGQEVNGEKNIVAAGYDVIGLYPVPENGLTGEPAEWLSVGFKDGGRPAWLVMTDLDGDGWQDILVDRGRASVSVSIIYGPLREHFRDMIKNGHAVD